MNSNRYTFLSLLLASGLAAFCIIVFYVNAHWLMKSIVLLLMAASCAALWFFKGKQFFARNTDYPHESLGVYSQLKNLEQVDKFIFTLDANPDSTDNKVSVSDGIAYIPVSNPEHLNKVVIGLMDEYKSKPLFLGLALVCRPAGHADTTSLLTNWLRNILFLQKNLNACIPVNLAIKMPVDFLGENELLEPVWFSHKLNAEVQESNLPKQFESFQQYLASEFIHNQKALQNRHYVHLIETLEYLKQYFESQQNTGWNHINVRSIGILNNAAASSHSPWHKFISNRTGRLNIQYAYIGQENSELHLPKKMIDQDSFYKTNWQLKLVFKLLCVAALALWIAIMCSAYNNAQFLKQIHAHVNEFKNKDKLPESEQQRITNVLYADLNTLKRYQNEGIPSYYGLGLYRADGLIPTLDKLLEPPKPVVQEPPKKIEPVVLTIDSLALFESGQYELKANANKSLINVIKEIEKQPNTQVIIEGHTDNVGNPASNQKLSEQRALAVRDWLVISSNIPASRFATKGYGDTKPIADNATENGKAQNRRVEIILIPDEVINQK